MLAFTISDGVAAATSDSILIPITAISGFTSAEATGSSTLDVKSQKALLGILEGISSYFSIVANPKLGFTGSKSNTAGSNAPDRISQTYNFTTQLLADAVNNSIVQLPTPVGGLGKFSLSDIFPGAAFVASGAVPTAVGILINVLTLKNFRAALSVADTTISGTSDNRNLLYTMLRHFVTDSDVRSTTVASAITNTTLSIFSASSIPPTFTAANSGIDLTKTTDLSILSRSYVFTLELQLNSALQTFDIRSATV